MRNAVLRTIESRRPQKERLFMDPFAHVFLNFNFQIILKLLLLPRIGDAILKGREKNYPGMIGNFLCRTRYIDDLVQDLLEKTFDQIVFLGAGFDTRPFRIPGLNKICIYEIDHPVTQAQKIKKIGRIRGKIPDNMTFIAIDFDKEELEDRLKRSSFDSRAKSLFVWEAVSQYIKEASVHNIFSCLSRMASSDSYVIFTYIDKEYIEDRNDSKRSEYLAAHQERLNEPWLFGIDKEKISSFLSFYGFDLIEQSGAADYRKRYLDPIGRQMNVFEGELVVLASAGNAIEKEED